MRAYLRIAAWICCALVLASCAPVAPRLAEQVPLVWPPEPDPPRIAYVKAFSRPADLGIARGFFQRVADALFGGSESRLIRPMAVVVAEGVIFVADPGAKGVHRFDPAQGNYDLLHGANDSALLSPVGLAAGAAGEVYVTDSALAAVFVIKRGAKAAVRLQLGESLKQPTGIAFDRMTGQLYIVDTAAHRVVVFARDGALVGSFGQRGAANGEFNYPTLIWRTPEGRLYVTDALNFRIQIFDQRGRYLAKFGQLGDGAGDQMRQKGVATDRHGHVYVVDALFNAMQVFDGAGRILISVGALGRERGEFWLPAGIFITDDDTIYVADSYNQRVQVFRYVGGAG